MRLKDLLKGINVQNEFDDVEVLDVTQDSRLVKEGSLFICIKGAAFDGHSVAKEMLDKGAAADNHLLSTRHPLHHQVNLHQAPLSLPVLL